MSHITTQKRAFKDCVLRMIGAHKSQNNQMNHHALKYLTPGDHTIGQIITALKKVPGWKGKAIDASWFKARLGTLKPPEITQETIETACSIYGCVTLFLLD